MMHRQHTIHPAATQVVQRRLQHIVHVSQIQQQHHSTGQGNANIRLLQRPLGPSTLVVAPFEGVRVAIEHGIHHCLGQSGLGGNHKRGARRVLRAQVRDDIFHFNRNCVIEEMPKITFHNPGDPAYTKLVQATANSTNVVAQPRGYAKVSGHRAAAYVLSQRTFKSDNMTQECYTLFIFGDFRPSDVSQAAGVFISPNHIDVYVLECRPFRDAAEIEEYKKTHRSFAPNRRYTDLERNENRNMPLLSNSIIEVRNSRPWTINNRAVVPGDSLLLGNLHYEVCHSQKGGVYEKWVSEQVDALRPTPLQNLSNRGRLMAALTRFVCLNHTDETKNAAFPEELQVELFELGPTGDKYRRADIEYRIRWFQATPEQRRFMDAAVPIPLDGLGADMMRLGTAIPRANIQVTSESAFINGTTVAFADIRCTTFVSQVQPNGDVHTVQVNISFERKAAEALRIFHPGSRVRFSKRILEHFNGIVWCGVDSIGSTNATPNINPDTDQPLADYAIWLRGKIIAGDLINAVVNTGIEVTPDFVMHVLRQPDQQAIINTCAAMHVYNIGDPIYNATEVQTNLDTNLRYFLFHTEIDETKRERLEEIINKRAATSSRAQVIADLSAHLMGKGKADGFKRSDFKPLSFGSENVVTIFGVQPAAIGARHARPSDVQLIEMYEEQEAENDNVMAQLRAITVPVVERQITDSKQSRDRSPRRRTRKAKISLAD